MLAKRIIPCLDINKGRVVKGINFVNLKDAGDPVKNALFYDKEGADELVFLDITASCEKRSATIGLIKKVAKVVFIPFTVGGGIQSVDDVKQLLLAGAEKVSLNTAAVRNPELIKKAAAVFGSQCIVVAIDAKKRPSSVSRSGWEVYINGGRTPTGLDVIDWAKKCACFAAGEILLTSMDSDGVKNGFDIELTKAVSKAIRIPVIASGGAGKIEHFQHIFEKTKATAALAASIFHYREIRIKKIKEHLKKNKISVRI